MVYPCSHAIWHGCKGASFSLYNSAGVAARWHLRRDIRTAAYYQRTATQKETPGETLRRCLRAACVHSRQVLSALASGREPGQSSGHLYERLYDSTFDHLGAHRAVCQHCHDMSSGVLARAAPSHDKWRGVKDKMCEGSLSSSAQQLRTRLKDTQVHQ